MALEEIIQAYAHRKHRQKLITIYSSPSMSILSRPLRLLYERKHERSMRAAFQEAPTRRRVPRCRSSWC
jgi:hypothetical protein